MALKAAQLLHLPVLPVDIALKVHGELHLLRHLTGQSGALRVEGGEVGVAHPGPPQQIRQPRPVGAGGFAPGGQHFVQRRGRGRPRVLQPGRLPFDSGVFFLHRPEPLLRHQTDPGAVAGEPLVGVVLPVDEAVLRPGGHHAVGLLRALGHKVVDEHADVPVPPGEDEGFLPLDLQRGVDARHKALRRRLLIAGGAVELPRAVQAGDLFALQRGQQLRGVHAVVLDGVGRAGHLRVLQPGDGVEHFHLHLFGQGGGEALNIQLLRVQAHGLDEELVPGLVGEADDLRLDGRAVPGADTGDGAVVQGGSVQIVPDDGVGAVVGIGQIAHRPVFRGGLRGKGEWHGVGVSGLHLHSGKVHAPAVHPGGCARLEAAQIQAQRLQAVRQRQGGGHAVWAGVPGHVAHDGAAPEVGAGGDDHGPDVVHAAGGGADGGHRAGIVGADLHHLALLHPEVFLKLQRVLHHLLIAPPVGLRPEGPHRRALAPVEHPVLDAGFVRRPAHFAAEGVQLPDQLALARAADGGIAGHVAHRVQIDGEAHRAQAQPRGGERCLNARVARTDHGDIKLSGVVFCHVFRPALCLCGPRGNPIIIRSVLFFRRRVGEIYGPAAPAGHCSSVTAGR